jgi:hypothetical protein
VASDEVFWQQTRHVFGYEQTAHVFVWNEVQSKLGGEGMGDASLVEQSEPERDLAEPFVATFFQHREDLFDLVGSEQVQLSAHLPEGLAIGLVNRQ